MTAAPFTPEQERKRREFDAAPLLPESSPMVRAVLGLAEELEGAGALPDLSEFDRGVGAHQRDAAARIRATVAAVLAADPEPRDVVIERMARAMWATRTGCDWADAHPDSRNAYRGFAAAALDASRGGTQ